MTDRKTDGYGRNPYKTYTRHGSGGDRDWMRNAACREVDDPELFFPNAAAGAASETNRRRALHQARQFCLPCPVQAECAAYAEQLGIRHGIWGGTFFEPIDISRRKDAQ